MNAGEDITINGGYLYLLSDYDAIDANGALAINGGVIVAVGGSAPEGAFDCDQNEFSVTGSIVVGIGGTSSPLTSSACTQNVVVLGGVTLGTTMAIESASGAVPFAYTVPRTYQTMVLSSPDISTGVAYTVSSGGKATAENIFFGLYLDSLLYSGGDSLASFTPSSTVTKLGGTYF